GLWLVRRLELCGPDLRRSTTPRSLQLGHWLPGRTSAIGAALRQPTGIAFRHLRFPRTSSHAPKPLPLPTRRAPRQKSAEEDWVLTLGSRQRTTACRLSLGFGIWNFGRSP